MQPQNPAKSKFCFVYCQRRPQKFFQGGASDVSIIYWIKKTKPYNCDQDFAKGFEPKVNITQLKKMLKFGRHVEQTDAIQVHYGRGSGGKAPSRWAIFAISGKK